MWALKGKGFERRPIKGPRFINKTAKKLLKTLPAK